MVYIIVTLIVIIVLIIIALVGFVKKEKALRNVEVRFNKIQLERHSLIAVFFDNSTICFKSDWEEIYHKNKDNFLTQKDYKKDGKIYPRSAFKSIELINIEIKNSLLSTDYRLSTYVDFTLTEKELNEMISKHKIIVVESFNRE